MTRVHEVFWCSAFLVCVAGLSACAQDAQFVPEIDAHLKLNSSFRVYLQAKDDRDGGNPNQLTIGPSLQFYVKPLLKLKHVTLFDLDDSKSKITVLEAGYRSVTAPDAPLQNRLEVIDTFHFPLKAALLLSDRNRADLTWKSGDFSWRYRNKLSLERTFSGHTVHLIPYIAAEPYYESQYHKWSSTDLYAGCFVPVGRHVQFNSYYQHENNTGKKPNQQENLVGLALYLFFSSEKK